MARNPSSRYDTYVRWAQRNSNGTERMVAMHTMTVGIGTLRLQRNQLLAVYL